MYESQLNVTEEALRARRGEKWTWYEEDVLPAWVADMDFPVAEPVQRAIARIVEHGDYGYFERQGADTLAAAFVERMRERFDWKVNPSQVQPVPEVVQAIHALIHVFSQPGDGVIVHTPIYPPFLSVVTDHRRVLVDNPLKRGDRRYELDLDGLLAHVDTRTRILLLCNPHNPTGRVLEESELRALAQLAIERDWIVISDEIHADITFAGARHIPFATLGRDVAERTVTLTSATKAFNIAGLRCAIMHFGSRDLQTRFHAVLNPRILGPVNVVGYDATVTAWREGQPWLDAVMHQLDANRARVAEFLGEHLPEVDHVPPEATYLAWLDCSRLRLPEAPMGFFLQEARVALGDGSRFGSRYEQCVRLNFATAPAILDRILDRMADAVRRAR